MDLGDLGAHARRGLSWPARRAVDAAGLSLGGLFGAIALARGTKSAHPRGVTFDAELVVDRVDPLLVASPVLGRPGTWTAVARVSRSIGLPTPWPDVHGLAVRIPDADGSGRPQDLLFLTSSELPLGRRLLLPARDVLGRTLTSGVPFAVGEHEVFLAARPPAPPTGTPEDEPAQGGRLLSLLDGEPAFALAVASPHGGFEPFGHVRLLRRRAGEELEALRFSPFNDAGGVRPSGLLNRMRDYAYPLSQGAWGRTPEAAEAQREADEAVAAGSARRA